MRGRLELEPLVHEGFFTEGGEGDLVLRVVLGEEVVHYGAGLFGKGGLSVDFCFGRLCYITEYLEKPLT